MKTKINLNTSIPQSLIGKRLDQALAELFSDYSRSQLKQWVESGNVLVNGQTKRPRDKVAENDKIEIHAVLESRESWKPQAIDLNIIYEDDAILVINKPAGLVVHPAAGNYDSTLVNALLHHCPELECIPRAGLVHRLDKDTTGLLVIAKTLPAHTSLVDQLQKREMGRVYQAIVNGVLTGGGKVDQPIGRHPTQRTKMAVVVSGKPAVTHYRVLKRFQRHTWVQLQLESGRTHQIRVHMAHIQHTIVGDPVYGKRLLLPKNASEDLKQALSHFKRQALHAASLTLKHPTTGKEMTWEAPLPEDMQTLIALLYKNIEN